MRLEGLGKRKVRRTVAVEGLPSSRPKKTITRPADGRPYGGTQNWILSAAQYKLDYVSAAAAKSPAAVASATADIYYASAAALKAALVVRLRAWEAGLLCLLAAARRWRSAARLRPPTPLYHPPAAPLPLLLSHLLPPDTSLSPFNHPS